MAQFIQVTVDIHLTIFLTGHTVTPLNKDVPCFLLKKIVLFKEKYGSSNNNLKDGVSTVLMQLFLNRFSPLFFNIPLGIR
jgi:hypothetical protein